ncbi:hypothetical protein PAXINDRAFT_171500 [Paxillus involutus ATCC 200175]|uniref:Uncharacterized protein n=1 Tax=Paxillus involutus ATCC 200175 TaxID=664439 RepID=A0A0C9TWB6_PAXIN|nr:hypothetical protein PAXINDRAFT_171500 [Paxillus involutus ATCC 200175]
MSANFHGYLGLFDPPHWMVHMALFKDVTILIAYVNLHQCARHIGSSGFLSELANTNDRGGSTSWQWPPYLVTSLHSFIHIVGLRSTPWQFFADKYH